MRPTYPNLQGDMLVGIAVMRDTLRDKIRANRRAVARRESSGDVLYHTKAGAD